MNQNLIKLLKQLEGIWKQLNAGQRISVIAATLVVLGGTMGIAVWSGRTDYSLLYGRLSDAEASKVIQALDADKTPYKISGGGSAILVPTDKVHYLRMQLAGRGIPKTDGVVGLDIFDRQTFGTSDFVQRANYVRAIQGELSRTISQLDEVEAARVMIVIPENKLLLDKDKRPAASVFIRVRGNMQLAPQAVNSIRFLVANSVEGLKPNNVVVTDNLGRLLTPNNEGDPNVTMSNTQLSARKENEMYFTQKAESMLEKVLGPGQAIVRVSAEMNFDAITTSEEKYDPEGQVIKTQTKNDDTTDSVTGSPAVAGGAGGAGANDPNNNANSATNAAASTPSTSTKNRKITDTTSYEVGKVTKSTTLTPGKVQRLSAAVFIAAKVEGTGATRKVVNRTPEELEKFKRIVQFALGIQTTGADQITLEESPFNDQMVQDMTQQVDQQQKYQLYWDIGKNVLYMALALGAFLMLLRMIKRTPVDDIPLGVPIGRLGGRSNGNGHLNYRGDGDSGPVTVEVLHTLIKENPGNVTQAVRRYLSKSKSAAN